MDLTREGGSKPAGASTEKANPGGDSMKSQPVTSTVSEDEHLDGNRGDEPWNHEKRGDAIRFHGGPVEQSSRSRQCSVYKYYQY